MTDKTMTLEQVRDKLRSWYGGSEACLDVKACGELGAMADTITRHISQTAEHIKADEAPKQKIDFKGMWNAISDRASHPPAQAAQVDDIRLGAPAWPGQMEGSAPPEGWVSIGSTIAPPAQPTALEDAVREVIAQLNSFPASDKECRMANKLTAALQENAK